MFFFFFFPAVVFNGRRKRKEIVFFLFDLQPSQAESFPPPPSRTYSVAFLVWSLQAVTSVRQVSSYQRENALGRLERRRPAAHSHNLL